MAMTQRLYSISALAVELGRDRRTVAAALAAVPADGPITGGHQGWFLQTALRALREEPKGFDPGLGPLGNYLDRLTNWREVHGNDEESFWSVADAASVAGKPASAVLTWLRAGCPYVEAGDFETGDGFVLRPSWLFDWLLTATLLARMSGDRTGAARLQLT